jgi:hypothetical protein
MGWLITKQNRKEMIASRIMGHTSRKPGTELVVVTECLRSCYRGNAYTGVLWKVMQTTIHDFSSPGNKRTKVTKWIGLDLLCYNKASHGWGYKDMDESVGPHYYSCPLSYLDVVPQPESTFCRDWRDKVRAYHAIRQEARIARKFVEV